MFVDVIKLDMFPNIVKHKQKYCSLAGEEISHISG